MKLFWSHYSAYQRLRLYLRLMLLVLEVKLSAIGTLVCYSNFLVIFQNKSSLSSWIYSVKAVQWILWAHCIIHGHMTTILHQKKCIHIFNSSSLNMEMSLDETISTQEFTYLFWSLALYHMVFISSWNYAILLLTCNNNQKHLVNIRECGRGNLTLHPKV